MGAILSFLGGSAFRLIWEQISNWLTTRQEHLHEIERLKLQAEHDAAQFERQQAAIRLQAEMGIKVIESQREADVERGELAAWAGAIEAAAKPTGIGWVDAWNGIIRPMAASIALWLWVVALNAQGWKMSEWDRELVGVILGFFFATRIVALRK